MISCSIHTVVNHIGILGNEGLGIRDKVLNSCTKLTTIQYTTNICDQDLDSLNVSVATGLLIVDLHLVVNINQKQGIFIFIGPSTTVISFLHDRHIMT